MNPGKRLMIFPGDSRPVYVPSHLVSAAQKDGATFPRANNIVQRGVDALPDIGGTVGGFMGVTPQMRAANATRFGIVGRAISHDVNALAGVEPKWDAKRAVDELGAEGTRQGAAAYTGEGIAKVGAMMAPMVMKTSLGRAAVGSAQKALKYGLAPTEKFLARMDAGIGVAKKKALALAAKMEAAGHTFSFDDLVKPLKKELGRRSARDVTGSESANALRQVLSEVEAHIGPQKPPTIPQAIASAQNPGGVLPPTATWNPSSPFPHSGHVVPPQPITPTKLQDIVEITGQKLKDLFAAKQGKIGVPPDPKELALMKVWSQGKRMLERVEPEIGKLNKQMQEMYKMHALATKAGERAHGITPVDMLAGSVAGTGSGALSHNPIIGGTVGMAVAGARHVATSPEALAAQARLLASRQFGQAARVAPRAALATYNQMALPVESPSDSVYAKRMEQQ